MLESLVASILNRFLGSYVENFDPKQLNIGIWSGDVKLSNLRLKKESLDKFELPVDVKFGHLGTLTLQIPWSNLKGKPVKVYIEDVYLLASPIVQETFDYEEQIRRELALKLRRLADLEIREKAKPTNNLSAEDAAKNENFTDSLVSKIVDNLQFEIKKIHLRYEDFQNVFTDNPYSVGFTLDELSAVSTDENWVPTFINNFVGQTHKLLKLNSLCSYWNTSSSSIYCEDPEELLEKFKESIINEENLSEYENYTQFVLRPVTGSGHLTVNKAGATETLPHIKIQVFFEEFSLDLDSAQYRDALLSASKFHWYKKTHKFKRFKPDVPINSHGKEWFQYAANSVLSEIHERNYRWSWEFLKERRDNRKAYIKLWKLKLKKGDISQPLSDASANKELKRLEEKLTYEDIKFFRSLAKSELRKERILNAENDKKPEESSKQSGGWLSSWWNKNDYTNDDEKIVMTDEQRQELYRAIEFDETQALVESIDTPRDRVNFEINAQLKRGGFTIRKTDGKQDLAKVIFDGCAVQYFQRPDSFFSNFTLQEFKVEDHTGTTLYKNVVSVKPIDSDEDNVGTAEPFFQVSFENNPLDGFADSALSTKLRSMTIFYHAHFINEIIRFFTPPKDHLDTIHAIMNAAEATVEGLTTQTRMGLEAIWEEHKTVNAKLDLQAPLIILPLDPHSWSSPCAVIDAGHISISSDLADKEKTNIYKNMSPEEYARVPIEELNKLMYDQFNLRLQDTQILIGPTIKSTIEELHSNEYSSSTILDKLDMKILLELSILPSAPNLAKIRTKASLTNFTAKMNDYQYKIMMQLLDNVVPDFSTVEEEDDDDDESAISPFYVQNYNSEDIDIDVFEDASSELTPPSVHSSWDASAPSVKEQRAKQHLFELSFNVDKVQLSLSKCTDGKTMAAEQIVDLIAENFLLDLYKTDVDLHLDLILETFNLEDWIDPSGPPEFRKLISSNNFTKSDNIAPQKDIFKLDYNRMQRVVHLNGEDIEIFDQDIDLNLSALKVIITRKSLLTILNFILTTFTDPNPPETPADALRHNDESAIETSPQQVRVNINLDSILLVLNDDGIKLATLQLSTAHFDILVLPEKMKVYSKLGALTLFDEINEGSDRDSFMRKLLSFDGDKSAEFTYETYDAASSTLDYQSSISFNAGSLRLNFVESPINKILNFLSKFQKMKSLYDSARDAAFNQVNIQNQNMAFDVTIETPIFVFPTLSEHGNELYDNVTCYLGEFKAFNKFKKREKGFLNHIICGLRSAKVTSAFHSKNSKQFLEIIDNLDITFDINSYEQAVDRAKTIIKGQVTNVNADLTEQQLKYLLQLSGRISSALVVDDSKSLSEIEEAALNSNKIIAPDGTYSTTQEQMAQSVSGSGLLSDPESAKLDFSFSVPQISLSLHNNTKNIKDLKDTSISKFSLRDIGLEFHQKENTHFKSEIQVGALTAEDTRYHGENRFTEIIPRITGNENQFSASISTEGPAENKNTVVMVQVQSPKVILALDYLFALKSFGDAVFGNPLPIEESDESDESDQDDQEVTSFENAVSGDTNDTAPTESPSRLGFSVNIVDTSLILLSDPTSENSEAIVFKIEQLLLSKQNITSASANNVGMFLCRMDQFDQNRIRIIDDFSSSITIDDRGSSANSFISSIQIAVEPWVMRVSLNDINLAASIFNKAMELSKRADFADNVQAEDDGEEATYTTFTKEFKRKLSKYAPSIVTSLSGAATRKQIANLTEVLVKAEELNADIEGLRLVIIGNVQELPVLDMSVSPFQVTAKNWSTDLEADANIETSVNIFNYARSSWEPLVEPWPLDIHISRTQGTNSKLLVDFVSRKLTEVTLSSRSIALLSQVASSISGEKEIKARGAIKPYIILNQTGYDINVWADNSVTEQNLTLIKDGDQIPWEFEDWKKIRENLDTNKEQNVIGLELIESGYDHVSQIPVTGEGEEIYTLTPPREGVHSRIIAEATLGENNVKTITLKSTITIENATQVNVLIKGKKEYEIRPSCSRSLPVDEVYDTSFFVKPGIKVPFKWSENSLNWRRLAKSPASIRCASEEAEDTTCFFFQAEAKFDQSEPLTRVYPHMKIVLSAPLEIENLLPYDLSYRLYDRSAKRDWRNFLKKGNISPVHVVKLEHFLLLSVQPKDSGFEKSDFAIINAPENSEFTRENSLTLKHEDGQALNLNIHYTSAENKGVGIKVVIYSPYIVLNRTGKDLFVRERSNVLHSKIDKGAERLQSSIPKMFSFEERNNVGSRALIRAGDSQWSLPVSFGTLGQTSEVSVQLPDKKTEVNLGMTVKEGEGKYKLSKVITFTPRFVLRNNFDQEIEVIDTTSAELIHLSPGSLVPLYNLPRSNKKQLKIRLLGGASHWSAPFNIKDVGRIHLKAYKQGVGHILLQVDIMLEESTLFINFEDAGNHWPFSIRNFSDQEFIFYQKNPYVNEYDEIVSNEGRSFKPIYYKIPPKSVMPYSWDFPAALSKELVLRSGGRERYIQLAEIGTLRPWRTSVNNQIVELNVAADGPTQSLIISNYEPSNSLYKLSDSQNNSSISVNNSDKFKPVEEDSDITTQILIKFQGVGISLINTRLQELCYITARGIEVRLNESELYSTISVKLKWIQIDNQLFGGIYPIILYPTVVPQSAKEMNNHPAFSFSISKVKDDSHGVTYIKYATTLLQEMSLEIDEDFLFALLDFSKIPGAAWNTKIEDKLCDETITLPEPNIKLNNSDIYFEALHLQPTQLNLSFVRTERVNVEDKTDPQNAISFFLNILTMAIGNINDAPIRLNSLLIENVRVPIPVLIQNIETHYGQNFFSQIHKVLGSADVIGNPVGLFNNISSGVMDIFYEPYQGLVMNDRPQELGIGVAKGGLSFLKKSVFGFSDSFAKVTGSIAKGLTAATFDKGFQERRRMNQRRNRPKHALYGFSNGANSFIEGISSGISGIALAPVQGANSGGAQGFFKGVGKGLIGLPTKTAIGFFDLANQVSEGIRNTTTVFDGDGLDKVRLPRYINHDQVIKPYNERESQGQFWLKTSSGGQYFNDDYLTHVILPGEEMAVIVTFKHILLVATSKNEVKWAINFDEIKAITQEKTGIKIDLLGSREGPFIPIPDTNSRKFLYKNIGIAVNEFNKLCQVVL